MEKNKRQEIILDIIENKIIVTQDDLQNELNLRGITATQSTVSRDIKELRLLKALDAGGTYRYINPRVNSSKPQKSQSDNHYIEMFGHSVISINSAMNDVVIKCYPGMASSACVAVDTLFGDMILGSLAGDDTIFIITKDTAAAATLVARLNKII